MHVSIGGGFGLESYRRRISSKPRQLSIESNDSLSGPPKLRVAAHKKGGGEEGSLSGTPLSETDPSLVGAASFGRSAFESELASARSQLASAQHAAVKNAKESRVALLELREALEARELELATARRETDAARAERDALLDRLARRSQRSPAMLRSDSVKSNAMVGDRMRTCLRRLDAARGAALLAAALAADARQAPEALAAAEEHLRAFAACAVDFAACLATALGVVLPEDDSPPTSGAAASPRHQCDGPSIASHGFRDALGDHLRTRARVVHDGEQDDARVLVSPTFRPLHAASSKCTGDDGFDKAYHRGIKVWKAPSDSRNNRAWR